MSRRLPAGKLPHDLLARLLAEVAPADPRVLLGPGVGRDAAVLDLGDRVLVAKADPVTFATDLIGWYVVNVNANDVACLGATPRWFMTTVLLPEGAAPDLAETIFHQLGDACSRLGVALVGGHTEITVGLDRPIVAGAMLGEATRDEIVWPEGAQEGDHIHLTKGIAVEGTALLAREAAQELERAGVSRKVLERAAAMLFEPGISVVQDALTLRGAARVRALHDPTEGGLSTALYELAVGCGRALRVWDVETVALPETREVCGALGLDPLGLLASGALLAALPDEDCERATQALERKGIPSFCIGRVVAGPPAVIMVGPEGESPLRRFERDELARLFEGLLSRGPAG
ncbi:MAG TPA: AIR synthase related protein, partial [Dehalococcoidia bacterium]|nr:AIR synthase related protein [Dehalococcoidia bacterium]